MKRFFEVFWIYFRVGALNEMQYRVNFFIQLFQSGVALFTGLVVLALVFDYTDTLGGWSQPELLAVMGVHILMGGVIKAVIEPNMAKLMDDVQQGTLDYALTKPEDSQVLISVRTFQIWQLVDVVMGAVVLGWALARIGARTSWLEALGFTGALMLGALMIYSIWLMLTTASFWFIRMGSLIEMFQSLYQAGRWPVGIYPTWLQASLTFLIPVTFAVTVPAEALTGRLTPASLLGALALTVALMGLTRWLWFYGLRNYSGASA
jgi:ABC-2 type transport system permease protein